MKIITTHFYPDQVTTRYTFKMATGGVGFGFANYTPSNGYLSHAIPEHIPNEVLHAVSQYMKNAWVQHSSTKLVETKLVEA